jgi:hypothetical protein
MKAIIKDLLLSGVFNVEMMDEAVVQIITEVGPGLLPQHMRVHWMTVDQDGDKETTQLESSTKMSSFLQAQQPLPVILQQTQSMASLLEVFMEVTIHSMKIFIGGGT